MDDLAAFAALIEALRPWLDRMVVVGGWAHQLYRLHPLAGAPAYQPLRTKDADLAFAQNASLSGDIAQALKSAGFHEELSGDFTPPISQYRLGTEEQGFYAEFLVPLIGPGSTRDGKANATLLKAGVTAQRLRHLELLLTNPISIRAEPGSFISLKKSADIMLPNPASFLAQKLLIQNQRTPLKQAQDTLYIHDTLELFSRSLDELQTMWSERVRPTVSANVERDIHRIAAERFREITDVIRVAATIPPNRKLTPEGVRAAIAYGLDRVFGDVPVDR